MKAWRPGLEAAFGLVLLGIGALIAYLSWGYGFGSLARPGPGLYPFFIGAAIAVFSTAILVARLKAPQEGPRLDKEGARTLLLMAATFCLWIVAMPLLGYVLVTLIATYAFAKALRLEGWRKPLAVSGGTALFVYVLFGYWLYIDLPRGMIFE